MSSGWWVSEHLDNGTHKVQSLNAHTYTVRELYIWYNTHILKEQDLTSFPCGRGRGILYQVNRLTIHHPWGRTRHAGGYPTIMNLLIYTHTHTTNHADCYSQQGSTRGWSTHHNLSAAGPPSVLYPEISASACPKVYPGKVQKWVSSFCSKLLHVE